MCFAWRLLLVLWCALPSGRLHALHSILHVTESANASRCCIQLLNVAESASACRCCMTMHAKQRAAGHQHIFYIQPTPLTAAPQLPWPVPQYARPDHCSPEHEGHLRREDDGGAHAHIWDSAQHPCNYFGSPQQPSLPEFWTFDVAQVQLPTERGHGWEPFKVPDEIVQRAGVDMRIRQDGQGLEAAA